MCCIVKCCNCHFILARDMAGVACRGLVCVCVHVVGKSKVYCGVISTLFGCFFGIPSLYVLSFF